MRWMAFIAVLWGGSAAADTPRVVADIPPVHSLVAQVMAGVGTPALLLDGTSSPHGGSLRPSQARALAGADLTVWMGPAMTPWLGEAIRGEGLALLAVDGTHVLDLREGGTLGGDGHDHDHGHGHGDGDGDGDGDHGDETDPHAWLDPVNARVWLETIAAALSRIDPDNAETYAANAMAAQAEVAALETRIATRLAPVQGKGFAVIHDAFHYFEDRFGLEAHAALEAGDGDRAGPRRMREVRARLVEGDIACLFAEPTGRVPERLTDGTDIRVARLDQLGVRMEPGPGLYTALLEAMAQEIAGCLGA